MLALSHKHLYCVHGNHVNTELELSKYGLLVTDGEGEGLTSSDVRTRSSLLGSNPYSFYTHQS